jgi:hypothetical protein
MRLVRIFNERALQQPHGWCMGAADKNGAQVLNALLLEAGTQLDEESLQTFMCETEAIVNSRPLTVTNLVLLPMRNP